MVLTILRLWWRAVRCTVVVGVPRNCAQMVRDGNLRFWDGLQSAKWWLRFAIFSCLRRLVELLGEAPVHRDWTVGRKRTGRLG